MYLQMKSSLQNSRRRCCYRCLCRRRRRRRCRRYSFFQKRLIDNLFFQPTFGTETGKENGHFFGQNFSSVAANS